MKSWKCGKTYPFKIRIHTLHDMYLFTCTELDGMGLRIKIFIAKQKCEIMEMRKTYPLKMRIGAFYNKQLYVCIGLECYGLAN
jgi:hypothetical protein